MALNVLILTLRVPYPATDGGAIAMLGLARHLRTAGHRVTIAALNTQKHRQDPNVLIQEGAADAVLATDIDTSPSAAGALGSLLFGKTPYNAQRFWSPAHATLLAETVKRERFDIIQSEGVYLAPYLPALRSGRRAPVVLRAHNVEYEIWKRLAANTANPVKRFYFNHLATRGQAFERQWIPQFDGIAAITERDAAVFRQWAPRVPAINLPVGTDVPPPATGPEPDAMQIGWLGSLDWMPNLQGLLHFIENIWPVVRRRVPAATLHIAGKNPPNPAPAAFSGPGIVFHGQVASAQAFMAQHPIILVPLLAGGGMRVKVVESLATGRCIVATPVGAEGIPATPGEHLLLAETAEEFATHIEKLTQDVEFRACLRENARTFAAQHYAWGALTQRLCAFYTSLG